MRIEDREPTLPKANIPTVEFPAADPFVEAQEAAVADETTQPENVYLSRVVDAPGACPNAKIPTAPTAGGGLGQLLAATACICCTKFHEPE